MAQTAVTCLTRLYVGSNPDNISNTLSAGQMEVEGALYLIDALSVGSTLGVTGAATLSSTLGVSGLITASAGVSVASKIVLSSAIMGRNVFDGESTSDAVTLSGVLSGDTILAFPYGSSVTSGDVLSVVASGTGGAFTVYRPSGGTSGLTYAYVVLRPA